MVQRIVKFFLVSIYLALAASSALALLQEFEWSILQSFLLRVILLVASVKMCTQQVADQSMVSIFVTVMHFSLPVLLRVMPDHETSVSIIGQFLFSFGMAISTFAILDLGSNFTLLPSSTETVSHGAYRVVRHPMYLGYVIMLTGWTIKYPSLSNIAILVILLPLTHIRIELEERLLNTEEKYRKYQIRVPYRLFPKLY